jgi:hypothetical protein
MTHVTDALQRLLERLTQTLPSDAETWDIFAEFHMALDGAPVALAPTGGPAEVADGGERVHGRGREIRDCRTKQLRALTTQPQWDKELPRCVEVAAVAKVLVDAHRRPGVRRAELYATRSLLQSALRKAAALYADEAPCTQLRSLEEEVGRAYESGAPLPPPLAVDEED